MMNFITLFCEDIREEKSDLDTIIGVMPDNIKLPQVPATIPKLAFYTRIRIDVHEDASSLTVRIEEPGGKEQILSSFDSKVIERVRSDALSNGLACFGLVVRAVASHFAVMETGFCRVYVNVDGTDYLSGELRIMAGV